MGNFHARKDPWMHVVRNLCVHSGLLEQLRPPVQARRAVLQTRPGSPDETRVRVTGRVSDRSVTVMWCNPTIGYYGAQTWCSTVAAREGICQMSGDAIHRGDAVFRPRSGSVPPMNAKAMILACHVELPVSDEVSASVRPSGNLLKN
jgi:hypothetical protein